jgi:flagellar biosynthesis protein FlhF
MKLRKFFGLTSRAVLQQVRSELGPDAMIVANRPLADGIEITAMAGASIAAMLDDAPQAPGPAREAATPSPALAEELPVAPLLSSAVTQAAAPARAPAPAPGAIGPGAEDPRLGARLMAEVAALRALLEGQLAQLAWSDTARRKPLQARITRDLLASGYSPQLARTLADTLSDDGKPAQLVEALTGAIAQQLCCVSPEEDVVARGGVYALVGPTGVGKTTTVAKIAARCAVRYGGQGLALLTTDSYRVGAHDQLRIYAKILGVTVHTVADGEGLRSALELLRKKHLVLIDTVGMGQRDTRLPEQATLLAQPEVRRLLLINATAQSETLEEVVAAYGGPESTRAETLAGCIVTKLDEAARPGHALDVVIRHRLRLQFVSNGQRVPEDLHAPNAAYLAHRSLRKAPKPGSDSPFALHNDEFGCLIGAEAVNA